MIAKKISFGIHLASIPCERLEAAKAGRRIEK